MEFLRINFRALWASQRNAAKRRVVGEPKARRLILRNDADYVRKPKERTTVPPPAPSSPSSPFLGEVTPPLA